MEQALRDPHREHERKRREGHRERQRVVVLVHELVHRGEQHHQRHQQPEAELLQPTYPRRRAEPLPGPGRSARRDEREHRRQHDGPADPVQRRLDRPPGQVERERRQRREERDEQQQFAARHEQNGRGHQVRRLPGEQHHRHERHLHRRGEDQRRVYGDRRHHRGEHDTEQQRAAEEPPRARRVTVAQVGPRDARDAVAPRPAHHEPAEDEGGLDRVDRGDQRQCDERGDGVEDPAEGEPAGRRWGGQRGGLARRGVRLGDRPVRPRRADLPLRQRDDVRRAEQVARDLVVEPLALEHDRRLQRVDGRGHRVGEDATRGGGLRVLGHTRPPAMARRTAPRRGLLRGHEPGVQAPHVVEEPREGEPAQRVLPAGRAQGPPGVLGGQQTRRRPRRRRPGRRAARPPRRGPPPRASRRRRSPPWGGPPSPPR